MHIIHSQAPTEPYTLLELLEQLQQAQRELIKSISHLKIV